MRAQSIVSSITLPRLKHLVLIEINLKEDYLLHLLQKHCSSLQSVQLGGVMSASSWGPPLVELSPYQWPMLKLYLTIIKNITIPANWAPYLKGEHTCDPIALISDYLWNARMQKQRKVNTTMMTLQPRRPSSGIGETVLC